MKQLYFWAEKIWFCLPQKLRFLLTGGFNTVFAYLVLNLLDYLFTLLFQTVMPKVVIVNLSLLIQYILTINVSFLTMRYYVFQSQGNWVQEWLKAWSVYIFLYLINAPILTFMIAVLGWSTWLAQGVYLIFSTIITFLLHKYYSFRKHPSSSQNQSPDNDKNKLKHLTIDTE